MAEPLQDGEHFAQVVARAGFFNFRQVWESDANQALRERRRSPHVLLEGDEVGVPEVVPKTVEVQSGFVHRFTLKGPPLKVRISLRGFGGEPLAGLAARLACGERASEPPSGDDGVVELVIPNSAAAATLTVEGLESPVEIGRLAPIEEEKGWRARLVNLGYLAPPPEAPEAASGGAGETAGDADEGRSALEEFQCDHGLELTGEPDPATLAKLEEVHGC